MILQNSTFSEMQMYSEKRNTFKLHTQLHIKSVKNRLKYNIILFFPYLRFFDIAFILIVTKNISFLYETNF